MPADNEIEAPHALKMTSECNHDQVQHFLLLHLVEQFSLETLCL